LQRHANGAKRIARVEIVSPDPRRDAEHMARLLDQEVQRESDGAFRVPSGRDRGAFVFLTRDALAGRYPMVPPDGLPSDGAAGLVLVTEDLDAAARALGAAARRGDDAVCVPPAAANGVLLAFVRE
jgi:hypothetical protein